jgi:hypothetical protein
MYVSIPSLLLQKPMKRRNASTEAKWGQSARVREGGRKVRLVTFGIGHPSQVCETLV